MRPRACAAWLGVALAWALGGCAVQTQALRDHTPPDLAAARELQATPFFPQTAHQCGPAALATVLAAAGLPADPVQLAEQVFLPARTGTLQIEMIAGARRQGAVATRIVPTLEAALREVRAGHPVVVLQNLGLSWLPLWHYAVLIGYDTADGTVLLRSGTTPRAEMAMRTFEHTWMRAGGWAFVALQPGGWPVSAEESAVVEAAVGFERVAQPGDALRVYRSALARWPHNLSLAMGLGNSLHAAGDKAAAAEAFESAALRHASAPAWINLAQTQLELGTLAAAEHAAQRALDAAASDPQWLASAQAVRDEIQTKLSSGRKYRH